LWVTHVAVLLLLGRLLRRCGFDLRAQCIALLTLGAAWSNIETLAWASCWISELSILFLLAAWNFAVEQGRTARVLAALFSAAGALTFSRGVFTGALLAAYLALSAYGRRESFRLRPIVLLTGVTVLAL